MKGIATFLGKADGMVGHAVVPFQFGYEAGGRADVAHFREFVQGFVCTTCDLIGPGNQIENSLGSYELAICHHNNEAWGVEVISSLAYYTLDVALEPGETMDLGSSTPNGSNISAFLFCDFGRFTVRDRAAGLLLCIGITHDDLAACRRGQRQRVENALKSQGIFPFTDLIRRSTLF